MQTSSNNSNSLFDGYMKVIIYKRVQTRNDWDDDNANNSNIKYDNRLHENSIINELFTLISNNSEW